MLRLRLSHVLAAALGSSCLVAPTLDPAQATVNNDLPPLARPGECYGRVLTAPVYGTVDVQVLEREAWTETRQGRPIVQRVTRKVLVTPERTERVKVPAVYRDEVRWEERPGKPRTVREAARYKTVVEKILVEAERTEWRLSDAPIAYGQSRPGQTMLQATGEVYCKVVIPARYEERSKRIKIADARTYTVPGKPVRIKHVEKVLVTPERTVERKIAAVYRTEVVRTITKPGKVETIHHPAVYRTEQRPELVAPPGDGWAQVVCGGAIAPAFMFQLQQALIASGYDPGLPDGVGTPRTYAALRAYQRDRGLDQGQLTVQSAAALGLL